MAKKSPFWRVGGASRDCMKQRNFTSGIFRITLGSDVGWAGGGLRRECLGDQIVVGWLMWNFLPLRSSGWVGRCATDRWGRDQALFLPATGLQLQYDPGPRLPASRPPNSAYVLQHLGMHFLRPCRRGANIFTNSFSVAFLQFCLGQR